MEKPAYAIVSASRNEEAYIEKTLESVVSQTVLPRKWVIVSDGSTDRTDEIISRYAANHDWIELVRLPPRSERSFAAKAHCFNLGFRMVRDLECDVIANLDTDVSFGEDFFETLLKKFSEMPNLGVAGTPYREDGRDISRRLFYDEHYVHGQCQLFRRACLEQIGGYVPIKTGGLDVVAVVTAKMFGWEARSFPERIFVHHRKMASAESNVLVARFRYGQKDYRLGSHPLWEVARALYQMTNRPYGLGGLLLLSGYVWTYLRGEERPVSEEFVRFRRSEQMRRLRDAAWGILPAARPADGSVSRRKA
jgi:poly-beta-1,6-N-acetyl-D-glucosamine synthase